jgi:hypothetical protein
MKAQLTDIFRFLQLSGPLQLPFSSPSTSINTHKSIKAWNYLLRSTAGQKGRQKSDWTGHENYENFASGRLQDHHEFFGIHLSFFEDLEELEKPSEAASTVTLDANFSRSLSGKAQHARALRQGQCHIVGKDPTSLMGTV